jgi:hypothetical protein
LLSKYHENKEDLNITFNNIYNSLSLERKLELQREYSNSNFKQIMKLQAEDKDATKLIKKQKEISEEIEKIKI